MSEQDGWNNNGDYYGFLRAYFTKITSYKISSSEDVDDAVSRTIVKLYKKQLDPNDMSGHLKLGRKILRDEIVNYYREQDGKKRLQGKLVASSQTPNSIEATFELFDDYNYVMDLINRFLDTLDKTLIALHIEGYSDEEIIQILGLTVTPKTVINRRNEAFNKLRSLYKK